MQYTNEKGKEKTRFFIFDKFLKLLMWEKRQRYKSSLLARCSNIVNGLFFWER